MHKKELIAGLANFAANGSTRGSERKGQRAFAAFLVHYFENLEIPHDEKYDFWRIEPYLPELMVDAFEQLRTSQNKQIVLFRKRYEKETEHKVPNITDLGASNGLDQCSAIQTTLGFMLKEVTGSNSIEQELDKYCNAQKHVLQQTFDKFLRLVYRHGMSKMISDCDFRGMSGKFGNTELRTCTMAGRLLFTFAKKIDGGEHNVSFVGEDDDPLCLSAGLQSVFADFRTTLDLIEDVINHWPHDAEERAKMFKADANI